MAKFCWDHRHCWTRALAWCVVVLVAVAWRNPSSSSSSVVLGCSAYSLGQGPISVTRARSHHQSLPRGQQHHASSHSSRQSSAYLPMLFPLNAPRNRHVSVSWLTTTTLSMVGKDQPHDQRRQQQQQLVDRSSDMDPVETESSNEMLPQQSVGSNQQQQQQRALGVTVLLTVPLAWGTYAPVVKYLYTVEPVVPGFVFSAAYYLVASVSLWGLLLLSNTGTSKDNSPIVSTDTITNESSSATTITTSNMPWQGGMELGLYLFLGNMLQVIGLKTVPADRAGFLVQLTTIVVPLLEAALSGSFAAVSKRTWGACALAFGGVVVIDMDGKETIATATAAVSNGDGVVASPSFLSSFLHQVSGTVTLGDALILLAAGMYSLHVVRLGRYAKETTALKLAASKATTEAILSVVLVLGLLAVPTATMNDGLSTANIISYMADAGREVQTFASTFSASAIPPSVLGPAVGAVLWTGWVTCAYTIYAQSFGQSRVKPTDANLIYTVQPIFTSLFAFFLLGETLGPAGYVGGSLIATAVYMVAMSSDDDSSSESAPKMEEQQ